ncbi:hypothetical protein OB69_15625 [Roseivirga seohaensis subsp. aquiponti]|uniref:DUF4221 domain-containing protein n=2 Tax=Roseivirga seohaensis TaxID=1914963 RepID=A0A0L8AH96_9BACT|nr:hypothetical protein OB69_15625 [Roseivirga seohaensis subsp. aquiponti]
MTIIMGCQSPRSEGTPPSLAPLLVTDSLVLHLDAKTAYKTEDNIDYFTEGGKEYLAKFNRPDQSIKIFSITLGKTIKTINMSNTGPNALVGMDGVPGNFKMISMDSIMIYSAMQAKVFLINSKAEILDKWNVITSRDEPKYPTFDGNTFSNMIINKSSILLIGSISMYNDGEPPILMLDKSHKEEGQKHIPKNLEIYDQFPDRIMVGSREFFESSNTMNDNGDIIVSFALDDRVMILNENLEPSYTILKNPKLGELKPYGKPLTMDEYYSDRYYDFLLTAGRYEAIIFDPYRKVYYRLASLPRTISEVKQGHKSPDYSIMVYNEGFKPKAEYTFSLADYNPRMIFVSRQGLNIMKQNDKEDYITFHTFITETR